MDNSKLIDGKKIAAEIKDEIAAEIKRLETEGKRSPHLAAILVGEDGASKTYVASKEKASKEVGFTSSVYRYPENISEQELLDAVNFLNNDPEIDGFIIQLPLPKHISESKIIEAVSPSKDVDGFNPVNVGKMILGFSTFLPATPYGIQMLLERSNVETAGKHCVVLGRSNIVGTPIANMLSRNASNANCTVTLCHSKTQNLAEITRQADILIVAIGKPFFLKADMVKEGATVIDVGIHRIEDKNSEKGYRIVGDVDFDNVAPKCSHITPVPGGVGPMTIVSLLSNTLKAYHENNK
ncbi:MAG: bifunctional 5,10-methylenetetrahydrofolate dehydrogenase/5,10-methenyltetrahydrofolate cyclohydrolase [Bacteroidales bacterium]|nr:bifunctional 5,10-methylenetetrahydrofolate dehydrogenase/5,10-methenyltetrahydrofolate cyclohydrolase [Bacteroidales bacterium]